jgi:hypothetical protein
VLWGKDVDVEGNQNRGVNFASTALGGNSGVDQNPRQGLRCQLRCREIFNPELYGFKAALHVLWDLVEFPRKGNLCLTTWVGSIEQKPRKYLDLVMK